MQDDHQAPPAGLRPGPALPTIVAVGASAGGLDALRDLFGTMVVDERLAFVVITHLPAHHVSYMAELLERAGPLAAHEIQAGETVRGGRVHVMPPGQWLIVRDGVLSFDAAPLDKQAGHRPVDHFMRSLADDAGERSVGIVLSGTDHDGTAGLRAIKAAGGWTMVQTPGTAQFSSMPHSAIAAGAVDEVMAPSAMAAALRAYVEHQPQALCVEPAGNDNADNESRNQLNEVLALVLEDTGNEFHWYRPGMLRRRIHRRMLQQHCERLTDYIELLRSSHDETAALAREFLIGVTEFFRDAGAWDEMGDAALPALLAERHADDPPLRVWTAGCSTGEEGYSIAMLLIEALEQRGHDTTVQVFATDIDLDALSLARRGVYPASISMEVSPQRLGRFFERRGDGYAVRKPLRDSVLFAPQNLVGDTPFSRVDLVLCRNVMMYFEPALQDRVVHLFHFALRPGGLLWLGKAESLRGHGTLFQPLSRSARLYQRVGGRAHLPRGFAGTRSAPPGSSRQTADPQPQPANVVRQLLDGRHATAAVLVDRDGRALYFEGDTAPFLALQGDATQELLRLVRPELRPVARNLMRQALTEGVAAPRRTVMHQDGIAKPLTLQAEAVPGRDSRGTFVVMFTLSAPATADAVPAPALDPGAADPEIEEGRRELALALEDAERGIEELRLASEEASSLNEELQSSNEELESSKEELQSLNEELATVNAQLEDKMVELAHQADDLNNLFESTQIATVLLDKGLRIRRFTPSAAQLFSLRAGDEGRLLADIASGVADAHFAEAARCALEASATSDAEVTGPNGRILLRRLQPFMTETSGADGAVVTYIDITVLRDAARQLQELISVLRDSNDAVIGLDPQGRILSWNHGAEKIYGHPAQEALTLSLFDLVPAELHDDTRRMLEQALCDGTAGPVDALRRTRGGRVVNASVVMSAMRTLPGGATALLSTERDITERRRVEAEVRFRRLADDIPALMRVEDERGMAQFVNRACCEYTGARAADLLGRGWLEFVMPEDQQRCMSEQALAHAARQRLEIDIRLRRADGVPRWFRSISVPHTDANGAFAGYVAMMLDVDDRKSAETELQSADRRKDEFLAMLAHELRNPLAPIRNASNLLGRSEATPQTTAWAVGIIERQTEAMSKLLDSLLDVARFARGKTELQLAPLELRLVLERALEVSQSSIDSRRQTLTMALPEADLLIEGDLVRLTQVFANLLNNASKYTEQGGRIDVRAKTAETDVVVQVADNGAGIAADMLPRVFDLFSQADRTLDRAKGGLGLGLTLVRQLVGLHRGDVHATSPGLGQGSTFCVRLPLLPAAPRAVADAVGPESSESLAPESRRVLVVDDNIDAADTLAALLRMNGHTVTLANDGPSALAVAEGQPLDVVILDIGLPGMDGYQVARTLRGRSATSRVTIVALTGYGQSEDVAAARDAGCDLHLVKPADVDALAEIVAHASRTGDPHG